ncbi:MAG: immune inhibitor A, partial [Verrucomicrobia bacterium]|nr:immune inhibitor A [Verrucomicrobiota bacterium]
MKRLLWALAAILLAAHVLQAQVPLRDDFEGGLNAWQATGSWGLSGARSASPTHAITDSPGAFYTNNTSSAMTLVNSVSLAGTTRPALGFQQAYLLEEAYDFGYVEVSTNGGATWLAPALGTFTGTKSEFTREQLDLSAYAGVPGFRVRFHLVTDGSVVMDGWYVDDVILGEAPAPVTLTATQTNRNSVQFSWSPVAGTNFASYRIYRSLTAGVDWHTARVVSEITSNSVGTGADLTASPKTKYYYRLGVVNPNGLQTLGNEICVTTLPGMDYPFVDNGEGGSATWIPDAPWALSAEDAVSPAHAWSDSPGMNYANGIGSQSLLLAAPLYLAGKAVVPVLSFNYKTDLGSGDSANVEISIN